MSTKACSVAVELDVHAVTCPGVWLSTSGEVSLQITVFGSTLTTSRQAPIYPLLFHERFLFENTFTSVRNLEELQQCLSRRNMYAKLLQWTGAQKCVVLATFETTLLELLYPSPHHKGVLPGVDIDLLMDPTPNYPGILGPKIEMSTKTTVEDVKTSCKCDDACFLNRLTLSTKAPLLSRRREMPPPSARRTAGPRQQKIAQKPEEAATTYAEWDLPCLDTTGHDSKHCFLCKRYKCDAVTDCPCCIAHKPGVVCNVSLNLPDTASCGRTKKKKKKKQRHSCVEDCDTDVCGEDVGKMTDCLHRRVEEATDHTKHYPFLEDKERNPPSCYCDPMPTGGRTRRRICPEDCPTTSADTSKSSFYDDLSQMYTTLYDQYRDQETDN